MTQKAEKGTKRDDEKLRIALTGIEVFILMFQTVTKFYFISVNTTLLGQNHISLS